jgi:hypothetical protein
MVSADAFEADTRKCAPEQSLPAAWGELPRPFLPGNESSTVVKQVAETFRQRLAREDLPA